MGQGNRNGVVTLTGLKTVMRRGKAYRYYRRRGHPLIALPDLPIDHPEFLRAFADAQQRAPAAKPVAAGSLAALIGAALVSDAYKRLKPSSRAMLRRHCDVLVKDFGQLPARGVRSRHIRANVPTASAPEHRLRAWRFLCKFGVDTGLLARNEAMDVKAPQRRGGDGHPAWTRDEIAAFRARWPVGGATRAAFELLRFTGARISDAVRLGPGMVAHDGILTYRQVKTGGLAHVPWSCPLPGFAAHLADDRRQMIEALDCLAGHMTWIPAHGRMRSEKALGTMVRDAARAAGVSRSAHGLRKSLASSLAEGGATAHQIAAWTGHESLQEVAHYTRSADRRRAVAGVNEERTVETVSAQRGKP